jgi:hypothetical protein
LSACAGAASFSRIPIVAPRRQTTLALIRNMIASGFGRWTANASALCR